MKALHVLTLAAQQDTSEEVLWKYYGSIPNTVIILTKRYFCQYSYQSRILLQYCQNVVPYSRYFCQSMLTILEILSAYFSSSIVPCTQCKQQTIHNYPTKPKRFILKVYLLSIHKLGCNKNKIKLKYLSCEKCERRGVKGMGLGCHLPTVFVILASHWALSPHPHPCPVPVPVPSCLPLSTPHHSSPPLLSPHLLQPCHVCVVLPSSPSSCCLIIQHSQSTLQAGAHSSGHGASSSASHRSKKKKRKKLTYPPAVVGGVSSLLLMAPCWPFPCCPSFATVHGVCPLVWVVLLSVVVVVPLLSVIVVPSLLSPHCLSSLSPCCLPLLSRCCPLTLTVLTVVMVIIPVLPLSFVV